MDTTYTLNIVRKDTDFEVQNFEPPEDAFGRRMVALLLLRIAESLDPEFIGQEPE